MKPTLIYITDGYPYKLTEVFPGDELPYLAEQGWEIFLLPANNKFQKGSINLPENVGLFDDLIVGKAEKLKALLSLEALQLLLSEYKSCKSKKQKVLICSSLRAIATALAAKKKLQIFLLRHGLTSRNLLVYTYWCNNVAFGISLLKKIYPNIRFISRAHGYDLYCERHRGGYLPFKFLRINSFDTLVTISQSGLERLKSEGHSPENLALHPLGVPTPKAIAPASGVDVLHLVSCSNLSSVKRLPLLINSISKYAEAYPEMKLYWTHYGGGEGFENFVSQVNKNFLKIANIAFELTGPLPVNEVRNFLAIRTADVFINVSSHEGLPVSLQEAACCGIPLLATDAGGNREIVNEHTGRLLPLNFSQNDFNEAVNFLKTWKTLEKRKSISDYCVERFSEEKNYNEFVEGVLKPLFV